MIKNILSIFLLLSTGIYLLYQSIVKSNNVLINFLIISITLFYLTGVYSHVKEIK